MQLRLKEDCDKKFGSGIQGTKAIFTQIDPIWHDVRFEHVLLSDWCSIIEQLPLEK